MNDSTKSGEPERNESPFLKALGLAAAFWAVGMGLFMGFEAIWPYQERLRNSPGGAIDPALLAAELTWCLIFGALATGLWGRLEWKRWTLLGFAWRLLASVVAFFFLLGKLFAGRPPR